jgi:hypothetical protein
VQIDIFLINFFVLNLWLVLDHRKILITFIEVVDFRNFFSISYVLRNVYYLLACMPCRSVFLIAFVYLSVFYLLLRKMCVTLPLGFFSFLLVRLEFELRSLCL